ncbi:MAG: hypothetical protein KF767_08825 [Bdellovibrionaceae bacterium]|nr:hypothetical protein [Pseudobdellovibrionaceae bacterium]
MMLKLNLLGILSPAKENFVAIGDALDGNPITNGQWQLFDLALGIGTYTKAHGLKFKPIDVILIHQSGGTITFDHSAFSDQVFKFTVTASSETRFRFLLGKAK